MQKCVRVLRVHDKHKLFPKKTTGWTESAINCNGQQLQRSSCITVINPKGHQLQVPTITAGRSRFVHLRIVQGHDHPKEYQYYQYRLRRMSISIAKTGINYTRKVRNTWRLRVRTGHEALAIYWLCTAYYHYCATILPYDTLLQQDNTQHTPWDDFRIVLYLIKSTIYDFLQNRRLKGGGLTGARKTKMLALERYRRDISMNASFGVIVALWHSLAPSHSPRYRENYVDIDIILNILGLILILASILVLNPSEGVCYQLIACYVVRHTVPSVNQK